MFKFISLFLTLSLLSAPVISAADSTLSLSVGVPLLNGIRRIELSDPLRSFPVVIRNISDDNKKVWTEWYSWGYYTLYFEFVNSQGKRWTIHKKARGWDKNFPQYWVLNPGDNLVINVSFNDGEWEKLPFLEKGEDYPTKTKIRIKAIFEIKPDKESRKNQVWVGKIESDQKEYVIYNWLKH